ncbi:hypothetical protein FRB93_012163 [Tulasnella sp. JGI-2019a]|nr:hypothetical protein FRB93_012163 [Tulasnella sp. JGI-2019a]
MKALILKNGIHSEEWLDPSLPNTVSKPTQQLDEPYGAIALIPLFKQSLDMNTQWAAFSHGGLDFTTVESVLAPTKYNGKHQDVLPTNHVPCGNWVQEGQSSLLLLQTGDNFDFKSIVPFQMNNTVPLMMVPDNQPYGLPIPTAPTTNHHGTWPVPNETSSVPPVMLDWVDRGDIFRPFLGGDMQGDQGYLWDWKDERDHVTWTDTCCHKDNTGVGQSGECSQAQEEVTCDDATQQLQMDDMHGLGWYL